MEKKLLELAHNRVKGNFEYVRHLKQAIDTGKQITLLLGDKYQLFLDYEEAVSAVNDLFASAACAIVAEGY